MSADSSMSQVGTTRGVTELWECGIALIPYPQCVDIEGGDFFVDSDLCIELDEQASVETLFAATVLMQFFREKGIPIEIQPRTSQDQKSIELTLQCGDMMGKIGEQGYYMNISSRNITISAHGEAGLFYGTQTLSQLLQKDRTGFFIKGMKIRDWPDIAYRAIHYDTKHHQDKISYVKKFIRQLAHYKINMLVWEWEDKFVYEKYPDIGAPGAFTMAEMQALTLYARQYHVQVVPLVQGLGHASYILKWPQYTHLREIPASNWEFCPLKDGTYELLSDLWLEAMKATPGSSFLHIGTDETYELGLGSECGCSDRVKDIGKRGLLISFINRCVEVLQPYHRRIISWGGEYVPGETCQPVKGLTVAEFGDDTLIAKKSVDAGYPAWVYDPNPGIEHLFLPYFYKIRKGVEGEGCLQASYQRLTKAGQSGYYEGMINTSWDDSGLHNQMWVMRFVNSAEWSWSSAQPSLDEFIDKFFVNYYGEESCHMRELWMLMNEGSYYYMDSFERKVWHWGLVGKTHLPDLPRGDAVEFDPYWNQEYEEMVNRSLHQVKQMSRAVTICQMNLDANTTNQYDFEIIITLADLITHTARTYLMLSELEHNITWAHKQHFVSHQRTYDALCKAISLLDRNLADRNEVLGN